MYDSIGLAPSTTDKVKEQTAADEAAGDGIVMTDSPKAYVEGLGLTSLRPMYILAGSAAAFVVALAVLIVIERIEPISARVVHGTQYGDTDGKLFNRVSLAGTPPSTY